MSNQEDELRRESIAAFQENRLHEAHETLTKLLDIYDRRLQTKKMIATLEDFISMFPDETFPRVGLALVYSRLKKFDKTIEHLEVVQQIQLDADDEDGAYATEFLITKFRKGLDRLSKKDDGM